MDHVRGLIGREDYSASVQEQLIYLYREQNSPLPEELAKGLPEEIITKDRRAHV